MIAKTLNRILRDERGQDLAEYGLLATLIALVAIAGITLIGARLAALYNIVAAAL